MKSDPDEPVDAVVATGADGLIVPRVHMLMRTTARHAIEIVRFIGILLG
jgi:hypothetical protein